VLACRAGAYEANKHHEHKQTGYENQPSILLLLPPSTGAPDPHEKDTTDNNYHITRVAMLLQLALPERRCWAKSRVLQAGGRKAGQERQKEATTT